MKRLVFFVEGDTELILINQHVIPYLYGLGFLNPMQAQKIITNRQLNKKGGNISFEYLQNDINRVLAQGNVIITTFIDFFRLPTNFPAYTNNVNLIDTIEGEVHKIWNYDTNVIPYIQKHELEALMFSSIHGFEIVVDGEQEKNELQKIIDTYSNPEDINNNPNTAPSKRMINIFNYNKTVDGEMILEAIGIDTIIEKCPRFKDWINKIINLLDNQE